jgi:hypothetical protein
MDNNRILEQIGIGSTVALITAIINQAFVGKVNYLWIVGAFLAAVLLYTGYQSYSGFPFKKFRVTNQQNGKGLLFRQDKPEVLEGKPIGDAWQFKASGDNYHAIFGPYLQCSLRKGKYRAIYKIKADDVEGDNIYITYIDVASSYKASRGGKTLAARTLTANDFKKSDEYQFFYLDFDVLSDETELEFRIAPTSGHVLTLDYIQLIRRLI